MQPKPEAITIFMVTYNKLPEAREIIGRIYRYTRVPFRLIIVDNNSDSDMADFLYGLHREKGNITLVMNRRNRYACAATNQALRLSDTRYSFYLCSRECFIFDYDWETACVEYMDAHEGVGVGGYLIQSADYDTFLNLTMTSFFPLFRNREFAREHPARECWHVQGGFYIIRMSMVKDIGYFNEHIVHDHMDVEYSYYAESRGWKLGNIPEVLSFSIKTGKSIPDYTGNIKVYHPLTIERASEFDRAKLALRGRDVSL